MHPSLTRPYLLSEPPLHTDIIHYENIPKFELVRQNILSIPLGSQIITVPVNSSLSWHLNKLREVGKEAYNVSYAWKMFSVRNEVMATSHVTDEWMTQMEISSLNSYIVRRYIATPNGVLRIYPGSLMDKAFDPTRRQCEGVFMW
ncbi:vwfa and cache hypothetical protein [Limosa lapponica baueri]|uniref:Uncharacterized protein n=1 Tax=Limosa lapponica baueri TaxID=1758121 RepID=A0A2I0T7Z9_LIMLA|nr:vwfa and cache hypothetical protein [Limosa lapponica baueri]